MLKRVYKKPVLLAFAGLLCAIWAEVAAETCEHYVNLEGAGSPKENICIFDYKEDKEKIEFDAVVKSNCSEPTWTVDMFAFEIYDITQAEGYALTGTNKTVTSEGSHLKISYSGYGIYGAQIKIFVSEENTDQVAKLTMKGYFSVSCAYSSGWAYHKGKKPCKTTNEELPGLGYTYSYELELVKFTSLLVLLSHLCEDLVFK